MANVHTLGEYSRSGSLPGRQSLAIPVGATQATPPRPSCLQLFLPGCTWHSFIVIVSMVQIGVFVISLLLGSFALAPKLSSLSSLGASYGPAIQHGQVWRLITPIMLHANVWHILFNVFFQIRMGIPAEASYGIQRVVYLYLFTGLCGNLLSVAMAPCKQVVGASTAGFGLIGLQMSEMAMTWHIRQNKDQAIFNIALFLLMSIMMSLGPHSVVDWRGHLGGFISGFGVGILYHDAMETSPAWYKTGKNAAMVGLASLVGASLAVIFAIPMSVRGC